MRRIAGAAAEFGVEVPADYAKDAKATKKRRERQDAYVQAKIAEAAEAEPEAEEAAEEVAEEVPEEVFPIMIAYSLMEHC